MYSTGNATIDRHVDAISVDVDVQAAVESLQIAIGAVLELGLLPDTADEANGLLEALEQVSRRVEAAHVQLMDRVDCKNLWTADGMLSAKTMVRHRTGISSAEAGLRLKVVKCCRRMPVVEAAYRAGEISTCNMRRLAHVFSNKRVRKQLVEADEVMAEQAGGLTALEFRLWVGSWESLTDEDGTCDRNQRNHEKRDARMVQDFDKGWTFEAWCAAFQGAEMHKIWAKFIDAEFKTDWAKAVAVHGVANVTKDMLDRSDGNRRMDALHQIFIRAASTPPGGVRPQVVVNVVMDYQTWQRELTKLTRSDIGPPDPFRDTYRCETFDGQPLDPTETFSAGLEHHVRRIVLNERSVTIDHSRTVRLFAGPAANAVRVTQTLCYWPGCETRISNCQIDHLKPDRQGGTTDPANGGGACGKHNRYKETGYTVNRKPDGTWNVFRPDGQPVQ
ncbi:MAG: DUF222 domain-containing protein [Actinobacteria bacterium]|nr:DUF222 domain-containing protein [Actinomycetota bacterium]